MTHASKTLDLIEKLRANGEPFCIATIVRTANLTSAKAGAKAVVTSDGEIHGFVGGGCVTGAVRKAALEAIKTGLPNLVRVRPTEEVSGSIDTDGAPLFKSGCPSGGTVELFMEPTQTARKLVIFGSSPVAQSLVRIAKTVGFHVVLAAPLDEHLEVIGADDYVDGFDLGDLTIQPLDAIVISTQGKRDKDAVRIALSTPAEYVSMVGSRRKIGKIRDGLASEETISARRIESIRGPAGIDIGAVGPEEIAISITAEIIACHRRPDAVSDDKFEREIVSR